MTSRKEIYDKYFHSNIFNTEPILNESLPPARIKISQSSLNNTKNDIFNTEKNPIKPNITKKGIKRLGVYSKLYGSDIFCQTQPIENDKKKKDGVRKIRNANNFSTCLDSMKNNEEYIKNLKNYSKIHRAEKKEYNPDKYLVKESAAERYYKEVYEPHGSSVLPERHYSAGPENKQIYAEKKKFLKKELTQYNDCGADKKKKPGVHEGQNEDKKIFAKKKNDWTEKNSSGFHYVESTTNPQNNAKINKLLYLQSHLFKDNEKTKQNENNPNLNVEKINSRIEEEKAKIDRHERYHLGNENQKRDLKDNDRSLWGSVHTKWEKSNLDWRDPQTELMFGTGISQDVNNNFGPNGPNAFQRKLNNLADTKNKDTINEEKKIPINDIQKPPSEEVVNSQALEKVEEVLNEIPNLKEDKKFKIKMNATTSTLNPEIEWDKKAKTLNRFYTNRKSFNRSDNKNKQIITKIGDPTVNKEKKNEKKLGCDYSDYVLSYPTKGQFEKFEEGEIKKIFGIKGVQIYDVQKNMFDKGTYNTIKFKVAENEDEKSLKKKMDEITKDFEKQNYKVLINKQEKKDLKKNFKNLVGKPGSKMLIINENIVDGKEVKLTKIPDKVKYKNSFSKQYGLINNQYKKNK